MRSQSDASNASASRSASSSDERGAEVGVAGGDDVDAAAVGRVVGDVIAVGLAVGVADCGDDGEGDETLVGPA